MSADGIPRHRSRPGRGFLRILAVTLLASACTESDHGGAKATADAESTSIPAALEPIPLDDSSPTALVRGLFAAARLTRRDQAAAARTSWNALVDFIDGTFWHGTWAARPMLRTITEVAPLLTLRETVLGTQPDESGQSATVLALVQCLGPAPPRPRLKSAAVHELLRRLPVIVLRMFHPAGPRHPVQVDWRDYARENLVWRWYVVPFRVVHDSDGWKLDLPTYLASALILNVWYT